MVGGEELGLKICEQGWGRGGPDHPAQDCCHGGRAVFGRGGLGTFKGAQA